MKKLSSTIFLLFLISLSSCDKDYSRIYFTPDNIIGKWHQTKIITKTKSGYIIREQKSEGCEINNFKLYKENYTGVEKYYDLDDCKLYVNTEITSWKNNNNGSYTFTGELFLLEELPKNPKPYTFKYTCKVEFSQYLTVMAIIIENKFNGLSLGTTEYIYEKVK